MKLIVVVQCRIFRIIIMEDFLQGVSNQHRTIYYAVELKIMDVKQGIKMKGKGLTSNQVKTASVQMLNHLYMLESILEQNHIPHIYQLVKDISINFNSVIAILLEKIDISQREYALLLNSKAQEKANAKKEQSMEMSKVLGQRKKRSLGGINLYNEDYARYIQDQMILQQVKIEKERRLQRKRKDILRQSILNELSHQTDVEQFPANSEDIANYIIRTKDKDSVFNYVSYEPELLSILSFFQHTQNQANQFLLRKAKNFTEDDNHTFSFADFHRDILMKNATFRKEVTAKLRDFMSKFRNKEKELQEFYANKETKAMEQKTSKNDYEVQTEFNFSQLQQSHIQQVRALQDKCLKLQTVSRLNSSNFDKQSGLMHQISSKQTQIDKSNRKVAELQSSLQYIKQLFKDQKLKKTFVSREEQSKKSHKVLPLLNTQKEGELKQKIAQKYSNLQESPSVTNSEVLRKTQSKTKYWKKNQVTDTASFISYQDKKAERDIAIKYLASKKTDASLLQQSAINTSKKVQTVQMRYVNSQILTQESQQNKQHPPQMLNTITSFKNKKSQKEIKVKTAKSNKTLRSQKQIKFQAKESQQQKQDISKNLQLNKQIGSTMMNSQMASLPYIPKQSIKEYLMREVAQQGQQETLKQIELNSNNCSVNSLNSQQQLMSKLNLQLKRIQEQHTFSLQHLFSITITPNDKPHTIQKKIQKTQENQAPKEITEEKVMKVFDSLLKYQGSPSKVEKMKKMKKLMESHIKSQSISPEQLGQIMCVLKGSSYNLGRAYLLQKGGSSLGKVSTHLPNSLKEVSFIHNAPSKIRLPIVHNKEKGSDLQVQSTIKNTEIEQQIANLIRQECLSNNFSYKFKHLHQNCSEGVLCSHISQYLQRVMKYLQQKHKGERKSLVLPVETIGSSNSSGELVKGKYDKAVVKGKSQHKQNNQARKNYSLIANKSQHMLLPNIPNHRASNHRYFNHTGL